MPGLLSTAAAPPGAALQVPRPSEPGGATAYTRRDVEMATPGEVREATFDALYAEAQQTLSYSANQLRALTERLRESYAAALADWQAGSHGRPPGAARPETRGLRRAREMLDRLEAAARDLEEAWVFLHRVQDAGADAPERRDALGTDANTASPPASAMQVLEAQEAERVRLADELHDGPAQALSNAVFRVEIIDRRLKEDPSAAAVDLRSLRAMLERELNDMRTFIHQLRPSLVEAGGLEGAVREAAERVSEEAGIPVELHFGADLGQLDEKGRTAAFRVAQEALRNVAKHSRASRAWVKTHQAADGAWLLEVGDDGQGFDIEEAVARRDRRHFGLRFMRERAQLAGGQLAIDSRPAGGTVVRMTIRGEERSGAWR